VAAVRNALRDLPCVDPDSVAVSKEKKEARFTAKTGETCDVEKVKKAVASAGAYTVTDVQGPATK
jgi:hypothetical protein